MMNKSRMTIALALMLTLLLSGCGGSNAAKTGDDTDVGTQSTDNVTTLPDTTESQPVEDAPMMVMVNGTLYRSTGEESTVEGRCGNMDGEITSQTANGTDAPTENDQSNFGTGYGYQVVDHHIEVLIDHQWVVFRPLTDSDV